MANVIINDTNLSNIAEAIRSKNGSEETYKPSEMAAAIYALTTGGGNVDISTSNFAIVGTGANYATSTQMPDLSTIVDDFSKISMMFWGNGRGSYLYLRGIGEGNKLFFIQTGSSVQTCSHTTPFTDQYYYLSGPVDALEVVSISAVGSKSVLSTPIQYKLFIMFDEGEVA